MVETQLLSGKFQLPQWTIPLILSVMAGIFLFSLQSRSCDCENPIPTFEPTATGTITAVPTSTPTFTPIPITLPPNEPTITPVPLVEVIGYALIDADTDEEVALLGDCQLVNLPDYGIENFNIRVITDPPTVGSVAISWDFEPFRIENGAPYSVFGDDGRGDYFGREGEVDLYQLRAIAYSLPNGEGVATDEFRWHISIAMSENSIPTYTPAQADPDRPTPNDCYCNAGWVLTCPEE